MHGGDIYRNRVKYDFSVNVNPMGMPKEVTKALIEAVSVSDSYPDIHCEELALETARVHDIAKEQLVFGNGASEIIMAICHYFQPGVAMLIAPGFLGYKNALLSAVENCNIIYHYLKEDNDYRLTDDIVQAIEINRPELLFITNPNNPDGHLIDTALLQDICDICKKAGTTLIIDECFLPLSGKDKERSMIGRLKKDASVIILRAFTKTFAMAGVRLGYAICSDQMLADNVRRHLPEWNVSVLAQRAGVECLKHLDYIEVSVKYIDREKEKLINGLRTAGCKVFSSDANYILFKSPINDLAEAFLDNGILIRDCSDYEGLERGYYRIAVRPDNENEAFLSILDSFLLKNSN